MPVDASIPLSGIAPKLPSTGELVSLSAMMEQMRERKLKSDQDTAQMASEKASEGLAYGMSAYYGAPPGTSEEQRIQLMRTAQREFFEDLDKSGKARLWGWNSQKTHELATHEIAPQRAEMILDALPKYKDLIKHGRNLRAGQIEAGGGVPLSQVGQAPPQPQQPEQQGPPMPPVDQTGAGPGERAYGMTTVGPDKYQMDPMDVTATKPVDTPQSLYRKANEADEKARQLRLQGLTEEAKTMTAEAQHYRSSAQQLEGRIQGTERIEQGEKRLDQMEKRLALSQPSPPLTTEQAKLHGEEFLDTLSAGDRDTVKGIADLDIDPGKVSKRNNQQARIIEYVKQYDPKYNDQDYKESVTAAVRFGSGRQGDQVRAFNVGLEHLDTLESLVGALDTGNVQLINKANNMWVTQTGGDAVTNFETAKQVVAAEVVKAVVGGGGALTDREEAARKAAAASSPKQLLGVISTYKHLFGGQLHGLEQQYKAATKRRDFRDRYLTKVGRDAAESADVDVSFRSSAGGRSASPLPDVSEEDVDAEIERRRKK